MNLEHWCKDWPDWKVDYDYAIRKWPSASFVSTVVRVMCINDGYYIKVWIKIHKYINIDMFEGVYATLIDFERVNRMIEQWLLENAV